MNLTYVIGVMEYVNPEYFLYISMNALQMVLEGTAVLSTYAFFQVEPQLFLKVFTAVLSINRFPVRSQPVLIISDPKIFHDGVLCAPKGPLVPVKYSSVSLQASNDTQYFFSAVHVRIFSVYLILSSL